jgi:hypothetical protein
MDPDPLHSILDWRGSNSTVYVNGYYLLKHNHISALMNG